MWEIEALVESSVRLVDKTEKPAAEKVNLIWNLYQIQGMFDCSFTHFRVMDLLLKNGYTQTINFTEHPDYKSQTSFFDQLLTKNFAYLYQDLSKPWGKDNPVTAYWDKKSEKIYVDCDSKLWNEEPVVLTTLGCYDLGLEMLTEAHVQKDASLIYHWVAFLMNYSFDFFPQDLSLDELIDGYFAKIRDIFRQYDYTHHKPLHDSLTVYTKSMEWFRPIQNELIAWFNQA